MQTAYFTKLPDGYYIAPVGQRPRKGNTEGGQDNWMAFVDFVESEVGLPDKFHAWHVENGTAHVLSITLRSIQEAQYSIGTPAWPLGR